MKSQYSLVAVLLTSFLSVFSISVAATSGAQVQAINGKIAYTSYRWGTTDTGEIYVMNPDGSNQTRLTNNGVDDAYPSWSPDASKIAFTSNRDGNYEIYVMNADGGNQTRLTHTTTDNFHPTWSPDGCKIAFASSSSTSYAETNATIWIIHSDGTNATRLTDGWAPDWSPDGAHIAFSAKPNRNYLLYPQIWVMNVDGSGIRCLTSHSDGCYYNPSWSPDGSSILYDLGSPMLSSAHSLWVMNADGSNPTKLTHDMFSYSYPVWSPDGSKIVFEKSTPHTFNPPANIYTMDANCNNQGLITDISIRNVMPDWSNADR